MLIVCLNSRGAGERSMIGSYCTIYALKLVEGTIYNELLTK